jgi:hypothetical protein
MQPCIWEQQLHVAQEQQKLPAATTSATATRGRKGKAQASATTTAAALNVPISLCLYVYLAHCPEFVARYTHFGRSQVIGSSCCCKQPLLMELASFDSGWSAFRTIYIRGKLVVGSDLCYWHPDFSSMNPRQKPSARPPNATAEILANSDLRAIH